MRRAPLLRLWVPGTLCALLAGLEGGSLRAASGGSPSTRATAGPGLARTVRAGPYRLVLRADGQILVSRGRLPLRRPGVRLGWRLPAGVSLSARFVQVRQAGQLHSVVHLVARRAKTTWEAALWIRRGRPVVAWAGRTGAQGADRAWSRHLEVTPHGILLYQRTPALERCDGLPPRMLARGYHFASSRLLPVLLAPLARQGAVSLEATQTPPDGVRPRPLVPFRFDSASSELGCHGKAAAVTPPSELHDARPGSAWIEGQGGPGRWEFVTAHAVGSVPTVRAVRILPGHATRPARYNRLKVAWLLFGPKARFRVRFPTDPLQGGALQPWWVVFPRPVRSRCLTLVIESVYPGTSGDTAVSELWVFSEEDFGDPVARTLLAVTAGRIDREEAVRRLSRLEAGGLARLRATLPKTASPAAQEVVLRVLARRDPAGSAPLLGRAVPTAAPGLRRVLLRALSGLGDAGVAVLGGLLHKAQGPDLRGAVARALVSSRKGLQVVLAALGRGSRPARAATVAAIAQAPSQALGPALVAALAGPGGDPARQEDLLQVAARAVHRDADLASAVAARIAAQWSVYKGFGVRLRLLDLAGRLVAPPLLGPLLATAADSAGDPILRERALRALARYSGRRARDTILAGLSDAHPRVRRGAVWAWGRRRDRGAVARVEAMAAKDPWPLVRKAALGALGHRCLPRSYGVLYRIARHRGARRDEGLRRIALLGLLRCRAPVAPRLLGEILTDDHDRVSMRRFVIRLMGHRRDRSHLGYLIAFLDLLARKVTRAGGSNEALAADLAAALGHIGDRRGAPVLVRAATVARLPRMRAAALSALARFCGAAGARQAVERAMREPGSRLVLGAAERTARRCGYGR